MYSSNLTHLCTQHPDQGTEYHKLLYDPFPSLSILQLIISGIIHYEFCLCPLWSSIMFEISIIIQHNCRYELHSFKESPVVGYFLEMVSGLMPSPNDYVVKYLVDMNLSCFRASPNMSPNYLYVVLTYLFSDYIVTYSS